ncbi:hypothetical protein RHM62_11820 [Actimicrobium sp. CCC2.4]|uniref:hypothetical protein n=2 Tax=Actimicrobium sp. CCC2.4 TaxID=3048606 RepID=UPI002AC9463D|nr:hypothetical protein [Actimicrobium sp. CCC2.4]WPX30944.1 hypothetical protein RHM62_11820 [Actimicrobium sp. CCC2.4]
MRRVLPALVATAVAVGLSAPPWRYLIEQSMVWHMAIQMPLLVLAGWWVMRAVSRGRTLPWLAPWNRYGLTGFVTALVILAYWMLPLAIDRAVVLPQADLLKLLTLFIAGLLLQHSFACSPLALQLFFVGYLVSMMTWLGSYFITTDLRLCNAYSLETQVQTGWGIAAIGVGLGALWVGFALGRGRCVDPLAG